MPDKRPDKSTRSDRSYAARRRASAPANPIREQLEAHNLRAQKKRGQNFLRDPRFLERIIQAADLSKNDLVLEIGPGLGTLTEQIAKHAGQVVAIEVDRGLAAAARTALAEYPNVTIIEGDVLRTDVDSLVGARPYKVVANLPYYITSPVLRRFLEEAQRRPTRMVVMVQREVANRMMAKPPDLNLLAIGVQLFGAPRLVTLVPAQAFYPTPKVDSAVVAIDVYPQPPIAVDLEKFFKLVHAGFSQPRKQVHNAIAQRIWLPPGGAPELLERAGIDPMRRASTLTLDEWGAVYNVFDGEGRL